MWNCHDSEGERGLRVSEQPSVPAAGLSAVELAVLMGFVADAKQLLVLLAEMRDGMLCCTRQWGKSSVGAILAVARAYREAGALVLVVSPTERQSGEFLGKVRAFAQRLYPGKRLRGDGLHKCSVVLPNGSRIIGLPATDASIRGYSAVKLLILDEAAYVPDETYEAVRPSLAVSGGQTWMMSSAGPTRGFFYEAWMNGAGWEKVMVKASECPRIDEEFLEKERLEKPPAVFAREYECQFGSMHGAIFDAELLALAVVKDAELIEV